MTRPTFVHPRERLLHFADSAEGHSSGVADDIRNLLTDLDRMTDLATTASTTQVPRPRPATAPTESTESTGDPLRDAIAVLFTARHQLPPDALRSLADIWSCGSAARCGEPHERFWDLDPTFYTEHDTDSCETENTVRDALSIAVRDAAGVWNTVQRLPDDGTPLEAIRINAAEVNYPAGTPFRLALVRDVDGDDLELQAIEVQAQ